MRNISSVLNQRSDLSTFVVHLTKANGAVSAADNLRSILRQRTIEARTAMGFCARIDSVSDQLTQRVVCFSETPLDELHALFAEIRGRGVHLAPYGVVFTKVTARRKGVNPVWYVDDGDGHELDLVRALQALRRSALAGPGEFASNPMSRLAPFIEMMGTNQHHRREFWWEREWRHVGDYQFLDTEVALVLCPEDQIAAFEAVSPDRQYRAVDPTWSLELMIAHLVGIAPDAVNPFANLARPRL